jgi:hypothetical protein
MTNCASTNSSKTIQKLVPPISVTNGRPEPVQQVTFRMTSLPSCVYAVYTPTYTQRLARTLDGVNQPSSDVSSERRPKM